MVKSRNHKKYCLLRSTIDSRKSFSLLSSSSSYLIPRIHLCLCVASEISNDRFFSFFLYFYFLLRGALYKIGESNSVRAYTRAETHSLSHSLCLVQTRNQWMKIIITEERQKIIIDRIYSKFSMSLKLCWCHRLTVCMKKEKNDCNAHTYNTGQSLSVLVAAGLVEILRVLVKEECPLDKNIFSVI